MTYLILTLAAYRITHFIADDDIPFGAIRTRIKLRWHSQNNSRYADAVSCYWCVGAWVSFALVGAAAQITSIPLPGLVALAVSAVVGLISEWTGA